MDKSRFLGILGFALVIMLFNNCGVGVDDPIVRDFYVFRQPVSMTNVKKTYLDNDVVFFSASDNDKIFRDSLTNQDIMVGNATFITVFEMMELAPLLPAGTAKHNLNIINGTAFNNENFETDGKASIEYGCPELNYQLDYNVQFLEPGNYLLLLNRDTRVQEIVFNASEDCTLLERLPPPDDADLAAVNYYFDVADVNKDIYQQYIMDNGFTEDPSVIAALDNKTAFFFQVN